MTNIYVFWRKLTDPPSPWTRLTRTNKYLRFESTVSQFWDDIGATTHTHTAGEFTIGDSVHSGEFATRSGSSYDWIMLTHAHDFDFFDPGITVGNANNNPIGFGLDIIYMDLATWETSVRSFPEGSIIMSNGALVDASLERYTTADGKYIVHAEPETVVGTTTPHSHTVACPSGIDDAYGSSSTPASMTPYQVVGDRGLGHNHTFSFESEAKYVEPKTLVTRIYHAMQNTSKAVAGTVVFVDGSVTANWQILTGWDGYNLKAGNSDPTTSGSDTHTHTASGNTSVYDGPNAFTNDLYLDRVCYDSHYHPVSGSVGSGTHIPASKKIIPARLVKDLIKQRLVGAPQIIGLW
jgi:hypothetical protein